MKRAQPLAIIVLTSLVVLGALSTAPGQVQVGETPPAVAAAPSATQPSPTDPIARAADPSEAVDAYSTLLAGGADGLAVQDAFVRRMVEFGVPELAGRQAASLNERAPDNGLAWCVTAYVKARQGDTNAALSSLIKAVEKSPDERFVQRTAGQLLAWYDVHADRDAIPGEMRDAVSKVRERFAGQATFADAYREARNAFDDGSAATQPADATQPSSTAPAADVPLDRYPPDREYVPDRDYVPQTYAYTYDYNVPYYSVPYYSAPYYSAPYYPYPYYGSYPSGRWCGWWGGSTFLIVGDHHSHKKHHHGSHHHGHHGHGDGHHGNHDRDFDHSRHVDRDRPAIVPSDRDRRGVALGSSNGTVGRDAFMGPRLSDRPRTATPTPRRDVERGRVDVERSFRSVDRTPRAPRLTPSPSPRLTRRAPDIRGGGFERRAALPSRSFVGPRLSAPAARQASPRLAAPARSSGGGGGARASGGGGSRR